MKYCNAPKDAEILQFNQTDVFRLIFSVFFSFSVAKGLLVKMKGSKSSRQPGSGLAGTSEEAGRAKACTGGCKLVAGSFVVF